MMGSFLMFFHFSLPTRGQGSPPHFTKEETEAQRGDTVTVICLVVEQGFKVTMSAQVSLGIIFRSSGKE